VVVFGECVDFCYQLVHVVSWCKVWLGYAPHVFVFSVHVVYVGRLPASAVFGEVSCLSAIETRSLRSFGSVILLYWHFRYVAILRLSVVGVGVVALVLASVIGNSGAG
jgi:hypothetical protein